MDSKCLADRSRNNYVISAQTLRSMEEASTGEIQDEGETIQASGLLCRHLLVGRCTPLLTSLNVGMKQAPRWPSW